MSREVDERIVQMQFDNAQFERDVQKSLKSLEALNDSLQMKGAEKGFERVQAAADEMDFAPAMTAVEKLGDKFNALEVIGISALNRLTNKVMDAGERIVKSLSIDNVRDGWNKYAQKTASVQTIVNATGKSVRTVNGYLDKLMWYAQETSYGFTDMTASLGQLTAAGGDIDKVIPMIMGIANATAYAGKGASEFSRVIYNLNQSYSQGYLNLMDWKSVELAGVATAELKQLLIDTAVEMGNLKEGEVTIGTFGSTLSNKWADKAVMETAFGKLAEFTQAVEEAVDAKQYKTASEAIEALGDQYDEMVVKAFKAAQEAKSFAEAMDATKEAVGSDWLESFEIIFGNYEEAKTFWTNLTNELWDLFVGGAATRNNWLHDVFDSGLDKLLRSTGFAEDYENILHEVLTTTGLLTEEAITEAGSFAAALKGSEVNAEELAGTVALMLGTLESLSEMSDEELAKFGTDTEYIDREAVEQQLGIYRKAYEEIQNGTLDLAEYAEQMSAPSGREHFFNGILNVLEGIESVLGPVGDAFGEVFYKDGKGVYRLLESFDTLTEKLSVSEETADKLRRTFKGLFSVMNMGFKALRTGGKIAGKVLGTILDILSPVADLLLTMTAALGDWLTGVDEALDETETLGEVFAVLGESVEALLTPLKELWDRFWSFLRSGDLETASREFGTFGAAADTVRAVLDKLGPVGSALATVLGGLISLASGAAGGVWEKVGSLFGGMGVEVEDFKELTLTALEWLQTAFTALPEKASAVMQSFGASMAGVFTVIGNACEGARLAMVEFFNLQNGVDLYRLLALIDVGALALAIWGVSKAVKALNTSVKKAISNPLGDLLTSLKKAVDTWTSSHTANNFASIAKSLSVSVALIAASMWVLSTIEDSEKVTTSLNAILASLFGLLSAFIVLSKLDLTGIASAKILGVLTSLSVGIVGISVGLRSFATTLEKFSTLDAAKVKSVIGSVTEIGYMLGGVLIALGFVGKYLDKDFIGMGTGMLLAAAGVSLMATAALKIAGAMALLSNADEAGMIAAAVSTMIVLLSATAPLIVMSAIDWTGIAKAMLSKVPGMLSLGASVAMMAAGVAAMAGSVYLLAKISKKLSEAVNEDGGQGLAIALVSVISILGSAKLLELGNADNVLKAAASMTLISAGLLVLAESMKVIYSTLEGVNTTTLFGTLITMALGLATLWGIVQVMPDKMVSTMQNLTKVALQLSATLLILTPALKLLGLLSWQEALVGAGAMVAVLGTLVGVGALIGNFPVIAVGIELLAVALKKLAEAFTTFAGGALKAALFVGAFAILSEFAGPICEAITTAAPDIQKALVTIIQVIAGTLVEGKDYLVTIVTTVFAILWESIVGCIAYLWEGDGSNGIKNALDDLFGKIGEFIGNKFNELKANIDWTSVIWGDKGTPIREFMDFFGFLDKPKTSDDLMEEYQKALDDDTPFYRRGKIWDLFGDGQTSGEAFGDGFAEGMQSKAGTVYAAAQLIAASADNGITATLGIASPSKVEYQNGIYTAQGFADGLNDGTAAVGVATKKTGGLVVTQLGSVGEDGADSLWKGFLTKTDEVVDGLRESVGGIFGDRLGGLWSSLQEGADKSGMNDWLTKITSIWDTNPTGDGTGTGGLTTGSEKTAAERIEEEYKKKLDANKLLSDTVNEEYELWKAEHQYSASTDELLAKKAENAAANIQHQTDRVAIAQAKYDALTKQWGADKEETKQAKLDLLKEQTSLADLKANQYVAIFEEVASRYDTDLETLEKEYELWGAQNEKTATKTQKLDKETEVLTGELEVRQKQLNNAQEQYDKLTFEVGEEDERSRNAYIELLNAKIDYEETRTELAQKELESIELEIEALETSRSLRNSRLELLQTAFDDGDLKGREDAYKSAVEQYGADSKQAKQAQLQGTTSSILSVVSALKNMNTQMQQTVLYQDELEKGLKENKLSEDEADQLRAQILSSQSGFLSYAEALADGFAMEDAGKQAMLKLAYAVQKNWKPLSVGFNKALEKVEAKVPGFAEKFAEVFQAAFDETTVEIGAEIVSTITYTMQGDWANAMASALTAAMDVAAFATSDAGKQLLQNGGELFTKLLGMLGIGAELTTEGGILGVLGGIGEAISYVIGLCPELWAVVAVIAAITGGIAGIVALVKKFKSSSSGTSADESGVDFPTEYDKTIEAGASVIENAVKGLEETATEIALAAAQTVDAVLSTEDEYAPCITPVVDLTNVWDSAEAVNGAFASETMTLDSKTSARMARSIGTKANIQNGVAAQSNTELLNAINGLGAHVDSVADNIKGMQVVVDGKKAIGYIDTELGARTRRNTR